MLPYPDCTCRDGRQQAHSAIATQSQSGPQRSSAVPRLCPHNGEQGMPSHTTISSRRAARAASAHNCASSAPVKSSVASARACKPTQHQLIQWHSHGEHRGMPSPAISDLGLCEVPLAPPARNMHLRTCVTCASSCSQQGTMHTGRRANRGGPNACRSTSVSRGMERVWICSVSRRPAVSGGATNSSSSKRPGRSSAASIAWGRLVAASTSTPARAQRPTALTRAGHNTTAAALLTGSVGLLNWPFKLTNVARLATEEAVGSHCGLWSGSSAHTQQAGRAATSISCMLCKGMDGADKQALAHLCSAPSHPSQSAAQTAAALPPPLHPHPHPQPGLDLPPRGILRAPCIAGMLISICTYRIDCVRQQSTSS